MKNLIFISLILTSCRSFSPLSIKTDSSIEMKSDSTIDYKKFSYKLYLGQLRDSIDKIVDLRHNYLADDGIVDNNGITHYMNIGEDLIKIGSGEYLPALFFTTDKQKLIQFDCSIMFDASSFKTDSIYKYLENIEPLFTQLKSPKNRIILVKTFKLIVNNEKFTETFSLEKKYGMIFTYSKKTK